MRGQLRRREEREIIHETTGRLLWARFTERASRELDPHLHTHIVIFNMTNRDPGDPMASLETRAMYAEQMASGQIYRNALAHQLREYGFQIDFDPRRGLFEIRGVPKALITEMSQRAEQINVHAAEHGLSGQAARRQSFYETRGPKVKVGLNELHDRWQMRIGRYGVKLWTEDPRKLVAKLEERSGEKTSALEGVGRLERDHSKRFAARNEARLKGLRLEQVEDRREAEGRALARQLDRREPDRGIAGRLAGSARSLFETLDCHVQTIAENPQAQAPKGQDRATDRNIEERSHGHDR